VRGGRGAVVMAAVAALLLAASCTPHRPVVLPPSSAGPAVTYVAVGASETTGTGSDQNLRDGWPYVLDRTALPEGAIFVNMGIPRATVAQALNEEMNQALSVRPNLVTVWLNTNDLVRGVPADEYERQLDTLVKGLRAGGTVRVLVANTPPLDALPAFTAGRLFPSPVDVATVRQLVDDYNAAIARVADRQGALLVDLHAAGINPDLISRDGLYPNTAGHAAIAAAFAAVLQRSGPLVPGR
jgi:lysophospholipase L1-like esterase